MQRTTDPVSEVDEAIANCRATLRATTDSHARETVQQYLDNLLDERNERKQPTQPSRRR